MQEHPECRTFLDVGCGEGVWQMLLPWEDYGVRYIGTDVVEPIIKMCQENWRERPGVQFLHQDSYFNALPQADVCFIKDVLQHWEADEIAPFLSKIRNRYRYVFIINGKDIFNIDALGVKSYEFIRYFSDSGEVKALYRILPKS